MIINYKDLPHKALVSKYLKILNTANPNTLKHMTDSEITIMVEFLTLPTKFKDKRFGTLARNKVVEIFSDRTIPLTKQNLNNKIYSLIDKDVVYRDSDSVLYAKDYILKGVASGLEALNTNSAFDVTFRFSYDKERHNTHTKTHVTNDADTVLQS